jgi:hypothetical protein
LPPASGFSDEQLKTSIENHERRGETTSLRYKELVEEKARRFGKELRVDISIAHLTEAAKNHHFTTYGALAEANGVPWSRARRRMDGANGHLDNLLSVCHARGLPLLTALCVNKEGLQTGELSDIALAGFIKAAQRLGYTITDHAKFLKECQDLSCCRFG